MSERVVCIHMNYLGDAQEEDGEDIQQVECMMATNFLDNDLQVEDSHICVVMVGLPARGKSLIAQKSKLDLFLATPLLLLNFFCYCAFVCWIPLVWRSSKKKKKF